LTLVDEIDVKPRVARLGELRAEAMPGVVRRAVTEGVGQPRDRRASPIYRFLRTTVPEPIRRPLGAFLTAWRVRNDPSRIFQNTVILPRMAQLGGTVLLVGCRRYTAHEPALLARHGLVCWTLDPDPSVVRWGVAGRHVVGKIEDAATAFPPATFDAILLSGVFGFGVDDVIAQEAAIHACSAVLKPNGLLVLGWNSDRVAADPTALAAIVRHFEPSRDATLAGRIAFTRCTHVFDFHTRKASHANGHGDVAAAG